MKVDTKVPISERLKVSQPTRGPKLKELKEIKDDDLIVQPVRSMRDSESLLLLGEVVWPSPHLDYGKFNQRASSS